MKGILKPKKPQKPPCSCLSLWALKLDAEARSPEERIVERAKVLELVMKETIVLDLLCF